MESTQQIDRNCMRTVLMCILKRVLPCTALSTARSISPVMKTSKRQLLKTMVVDIIEAQIMHIMWQLLLVVRFFCSDVVTAGVGASAPRVFQPHQRDKVARGGGCLPRSHDISDGQVVLCGATHLQWNYPRGPGAFVKLVPRLGIGWRMPQLICQCAAMRLAGIQTLQPEDLEVLFHHLAEASWLTGCSNTETWPLPLGNSGVSRHVWSHPYRPLILASGAQLFMCRCAMSR